MRRMSCLTVKVSICPPRIKDREMSEQQEPKVTSPDEGQSRSTVELATISERVVFENWFNAECSLPDINTIYGTVAWAAWKARAKAANVKLTG